MSPNTRKYINSDRTTEATLHDLVDAYSTALLAATNKFNAAMMAAWDALHSEMKAAEQAFEHGRESRMAIFYAGPIALPKSDIPEDVANKLREAVGAALDGVANATAMR